MQAGTDAVLAKPIAKPGNGGWRSLSKAVVANAPAGEPVVTARWPGWATVALAVGGSGLGWFLIVGAAVLMLRH